MKLVYPAVFYKCEEGGYTIEFPDLPGCVTQGENIEEALEMAVDAASGWVLITTERGEDVPPPTINVDLSFFEGAEFINLIMLDMEEYAKQYGEKAVKKTLTIPRWLNTLAEKENINFSHTLQKALKKELGLNYETVREASTITMETVATDLIERVEKLLPKFPQNTIKETTNSEIQRVTIINPFNMFMNPQ